MSDILDLAPPKPDHVVRYGAEGPQFGELRLPAEASGRAPVVVVVHGGFWRAQYSLGHIGHLCAALTGEGWATWSIEYRRLGEPGGGWPGTFLDAAAGLDHVRALAADWPLDLDRVATIGHSAGGHLALWLAGRHRIPTASPIGPLDAVRPTGAVALAAVSDLAMAVERGLGSGITSQLMGGGPGQYPDRYAAGSPAELLPLGGRTVLVHGEADRVVPVEMSRHYWQLATARGDGAELITLAGAGHFDLIDPRSWVFPTVRDAVRTALGAYSV